jgi:hypothetical protein
MMYFEIIFGKNKKSTTKSNTNWINEEIFESMVCYFGTHNQFHLRLKDLNFLISPNILKHSLKITLKFRIQALDVIYENNFKSSCILKHLLGYFISKLSCH